MNLDVEARLEAQFAEAEACGTCLMPERNDRRALSRVALDVSEVDARHLSEDDLVGVRYVQPFPRCYLRRSYWAELDPCELSLHVIKALAQAHPTWVFCSYSAALLHGLDVSWNLGAGDSYRLSRQGRFEKLGKAGAARIPWA